MPPRHGSAPHLNLNHLVTDGSWRRHPWSVAFACFRHNQWMGDEACCRHERAEPYETHLEKYKLLCSVALCAMAVNTTTLIAVAAAQSGSNDTPREGPLVVARHSNFVPVE